MKQTEKNAQQPPLPQQNKNHSKYNLLRSANIIFRKAGRMRVYKFTGGQPHLMFLAWIRTNSFCTPAQHTSTPPITSYQKQTDQHICISWLFSSTYIRLMEACAVRILYCGHRQSYCLTTTTTTLTTTQLGRCVLCLWTVALPSGACIK